MNNLPQFQTSASRSKKAKTATKAPTKKKTPPTSTYKKTNANTIAITTMTNLKTFTTNSLITKANITITISSRIIGHKMSIIITDSHSDQIKIITLIIKGIIMTSIMTINVIMMYRRISTKKRM